MGYSKICTSLTTMEGWLLLASRRPMVHISFVLPLSSPIPHTLHASPFPFFKLKASQTHFWNFNFPESWRVGIPIDFR